jgi:hypothetical protein
MIPNLSNQCARRGCGRNVVNGMQCDCCSGWFHETCTGLSALQYKFYSAPSRHFCCMACLSDRLPSVHAAHSSKPFDSETQCSSQDAPDNAPGTSGTSGVPEIPFYPTELKDLEDRISQQSLALKTIKQALRDLADTSACLALQLSRIESMCATSLPLAKAADETLKLSRHLIEEAAYKKADSDSRACNVLLRGLKFSGDAFNTANEVLSFLSAVHPHLKVVKASWFFHKSHEAIRPLLITLETPAQRNAVLQSRRLLHDSFPNLSISPDLPVHLRGKNLENPVPTLHSLSIPLTDAQPSAQSDTHVNRQQHTPPPSLHGIDNETSSHPDGRGLTNPTDQGEACPSVAQCQTPIRNPQIQPVSARSSAISSQSPTVSKNGTAYNARRPRPLQSRAGILGYGPYPTAPPTGHPLPVPRKVMHKNPKGNRNDQRSPKVGIRSRPPNLPQTHFPPPLMSLPITPPFSQQTVIQKLLPLLHFLLPLIQPNHVPPYLLPSYPLNPNIL